MLVTFGQLPSPVGQIPEALLSELSQVSPAKAAEDLAYDQVHDRDYILAKLSKLADLKTPEEYHKLPQSEREKYIYYPLVLVRYDKRLDSPSIDSDSLRSICSLTSLHTNDTMMSLPSFASSETANSAFKNASSRSTGLEPSFHVEEYWLNVHNSSMYTQDESTLFFADCQTGVTPPYQMECMRKRSTFTSQFQQPILKSLSNLKKASTRKNIPFGKINILEYDMLWGPDGTPRYVKEQGYIPEMLLIEKNINMADYHIPHTILSRIVVWEGASSL